MRKAEKLAISRLEKAAECEWTLRNGKYSSRQGWSNTRNFLDGMRAAFMFADMFEAADVAQTLSDLALRIGFECEK